MKTTTRLISIVAIAMVLALAFSGVALASCPVNETNQTARIQTTTVVTCVGTMTEDESLSFEQSGLNLAALPPLGVGEVYGNTRYSESMLARDGYTDYIKDFDLDTANSGGRPNYNLEVEKNFDYVANNGGGLIYSESVAIDSISMFQGAAQVMCPFAAPSGTIPESCEYVYAGSDLDVTEVSATTHARTITTARACDTTPVILHYDVRAGPTDLTATAGAVGSGSAYMTVHDLAGRSPAGTLGSEITYEETTTVSGLFDLYKNMDYESGILRP